MARKIKDPQIDDRGDFTYRLLEEKEQPMLKKLIENYKADKFKARVLYFNSPNNGYFNEREVLFEYANGDFKINKYKRKFGISKTGILYNHENLESSLIYSKRKFYLKTLNRFTVPTHAYLRSNSNSFSKAAFEFLNNRFGWMRNLMEYKFYYPISLNTFVTYKLFNEKKILKHIFKAPYPVIELLLDLKNPKNDNFSNSQNHFVHTFKIWKEMRQYLINVESLTKELYNDHHFNDACKMAKTLGYRVNCSWSKRRLKEEHDNWSKIIANIVLESQPLQELRVGKIFRAFGEYSGFEVLDTNYALVREGMRQHHCVGSYVNAVDTGQCGIYRVGNYTLELRYGIQYYYKTEDRKTEKELYISQMMAIRNVPAPNEEKLKVIDLMDKFMKSYDIKNIHGDEDEENKKCRNLHIEEFQFQLQFADLNPF